MSLQHKNYIKITLFDSDISPSSLNDPPPYKIKIKFNSQTHETEKINTSRYSFPGGKCFYFELSPSSPNLQGESITISAIGTSWMVFNSTLSSISIPFYENIQNFNDQKKTYTLSSPTQNDFCIELKCSIWCEFASSNNQTQNETSMLNKTYTNVKCQNDLSYYENITAALNNTTNAHRRNSIENCINNSSNTITECNSILSPFSERQNSSNINNISNISFGLGCNEILSMIDAFLEKNGNDTDTIERIKNQVNALKEKEESIKNQQIINNKNLEKIKEKETALNKEKIKLEEKIKKFKATQSEFDKKNLNLAQSTLKFENELTQYVISREIYDNTKSLFYSINHYIQSGVDITSDQSNITSETQQTTQYDASTSLRNSIPNNPTPSNSKSKTKEVVMETVSKYLPPQNDNKAKHSPPIAQINLNFYDYQTPKNEKHIENKLIDSLECNFIPHVMKNNHDNNGNTKTNKKGKVVKRNSNIVSTNDNVNMSNISKIKTKNISSSIGQTMQALNRANKNNIMFNTNNKSSYYKRDFSSSNNNGNNSTKNDISLSSHKVVVSHKKAFQNKL